MPTVTRSPGTDELMPAFRYHPDPLGTGVVERSDTTCVVCDRARGLIYVGPVYSVEEHVDEICPWCIADGSAATSLDAQFTDVRIGVPADVPPDVMYAVAARTPGFHGWQQEHWLYHCGDAAAFLGAVGDADLRALPDAHEMLLHENDCFGWTPEQSASYVESIRADGETTAYLFQCLHCDRHLAYSDMAC